MFLRPFSRLRKLFADHFPSARVSRRAPRKELRVEYLEDRAVPAALVWTDKPDYAPGQTAYIGGSGFALGETVQLQVLHTDGTPNTGSDHDPFYVTDGGAGDLDGKKDGNIQTSWYVNPDDSAGSTFQLTAQGLSSGQLASTTFTDSAPSVKLGAYGNTDGSYLGGNLSSSQAAYTEGNAVPYRYAGANAEEGATITILISYQFQSVTSGGGGGEVDNTFDYLTSDNFTVKSTTDVPAGPMDRLGGSNSTIPSGGWTPSAAFSDTIAVPDDPTITTDDAGGQNILVYSNFANTSIVSATYAGIDPTDANHKIIQLVLQMGNDGDGTPNEPIVDFGVYWGGHLARNIDYTLSPHDGAGDAPGSSFKMDVRATQDRSGNIGNETSNLQAGAVVETSLSWEKRTSGGALLGGATFSVSPNPYTGTGTLTFTDNDGVYDTDPDPGQITLSGILFSATPYTITEVAAPAGYLRDTTTRSATVNQATPVVVVGTQGVDDAQDFHNILATPVLTIDKAFVNVTGGDGDAVADAAGDVLNYTVTVTNNGNVTLHNVTVTDPLTGQNSLIPALAPGASQTFDTSYTLTQADVDGKGGGDGDIDNTATADSDETAPVSDSVAVPLAYNAALAISKAFVNVTGGNGNTLADFAGDVLNYTVTVTNTGHVTLTGVTVVDPLTGQNVPAFTLAPGVSQTFNASYTLTQADLNGSGNAGSDHDIDNTATADSNETPAASDSAEVPLTYNPALTIDKTFLSVTGGNTNGVADFAGDVLNYTVKVTNLGNVTLNNVTVADPLTGLNITGASAFALAPGASQTFNASYTLTQADLDGLGNAGPDHDIDNTATADSDETAPASDSETVPLVYSPSIAIDKAFVNVTGGNGNPLADFAGDVLNYTVKVTNTGNVTLTGVTVIDPLTGQNVPAFTLAPGASQTFNTSYTLTQADLNGSGNAGSDHDIDNTATADSNETPAASDSETVPLVYNPALAISKAFVNVTGGNANGVADFAGDVLNYTVKVTNTGNVTLTGVTVIDPLTGQNVPPFTLAPGASQTFNTSYTLTQADLDNNGGGDGDIDNTATADSNETPAASDSEAVPLAVGPAITIDKAFVNVTGGNGNALPDAVGDVLNYTVKVTNLGNVTLNNVTVADPLTGLNITGASAFALAPGASQTFNASYTLTQADLDGLGNAGPDHDIDNTATADSDETAPVSDSETVPLVYSPSIAIDKTFVNVTGGNGNAAADAVNDVLNYTVKVTNTGNVTLTNVTVVDPLTGLNITGVTLTPAGTPGASQTFNASYTLTQADLDGSGNAGSDHDIDNTATADSDETAPVSDSETVPLTYAPSIAIDKTFVNVTGGDSDNIADDAGDVLNYTVTVTNNGNVTLHNVTVTDPLTGQNSLIPALAPGASQTFDTSYTLTQADVDGKGGGDGDIDNTATADSDETAPVSDSEAVPLIYNAAIAIDKVFVNVTGGDGDGVADAAGDVLNYTVTVTNTGHVTLTGVTVVDPLTGLNITGPLAFTLTPAGTPGASRTFNASYTLTQADVDGKGGGDGDIDNTATADSDETAPVSDSEAVPLAYNAGMIIDKAFVNVTGGNGNTLADFAGDVLNYTVTVTNTGHVTLTNVTVADPLTGLNIGGVTLTPAGTPGASRTFNASHTLTQADLDGRGNGNGFFDNIATADSDETAPVSDSATVPLVYEPGILVDKAFAGVTGGNNNGIPDQVGEVLNYTFVVTNTGNVTLTNVTIADPGVTVTGGPITLAPGASDGITFTATYTLTQADLTARFKNNTAIATGTPPAGGTVSGQDSERVDLTQPPVAVDDSSLNNLPGPVTLNVLPNDFDPNGDLLPNTVDLDPATAGRQTTLVVPGQGTWTVDDQGNVTFAPESGFKGNPAPITYTVSDATQLTSNAATITITYIPLGRITVQKLTDPAGTSDQFPFSASFGDFTLGAGGVYSIELVPGTYNLTEIVPAGWRLVDVTANDPTGSNPRRGNGTTIDLAPGETVTVQFTDFAVVIPPDLVGKVEFLSNQAMAGAAGMLVNQAYYVNELFNDLLGRVPSPMEVNAGVALLQAGVPMPQLAQLFWNSVEHRVIQVNQYFQEFLGHSADPLSLLFSVSALINGLSEADFVVLLVNSPEYTAAHPDNASFVAALGEDLLGRPFDAGTAQFYEQYLNSGGSRVLLTRFVLKTPEVLAAQVDRYYEEFLHREPTLAETQFWVVAETFNLIPPESFPILLLSSGEYFAKSP